MTRQEDSLAEGKRRLPIAELWRRLGLRGTPGRSCRSPFREDRRPSFSITPDGAHWRDFGTGDHGDAVDFLVRARGLTISAAIEEFRRLAGVPLVPTKPPLPLPAGQPDLHVGTVSELEQLASLRNLSLEGLRLASDRGLLRFGRYRGAPSWFVTDPNGTNAQARRLDGRPWANDAKALSLPGSRAALPIGAHAAAGFPVLLFCEGGPDLVAAFHFIAVEDRKHDAAAVGMLGASLTIPDECVPQFAGKRVRLIAHADERGRAGVQRWANQLAGVVCLLDAVDLGGLRRTDGSPVKDLNDLSSVHPDDFEANRELWHLVPPA